MPNRHQLIYSCPDPGWETDSHFLQVHIYFPIQSTLGNFLSKWEEGAGPKNCHACPISVRYCGPRELQFGLWHHRSFSVYLPLPPCGHYAPLQLLLLGTILRYPSHTRGCRRQKDMTRLRPFVTRPSNGRSRSTAGSFAWPGASGAPGTGGGGRS